jgi:hypothetical protein
MSEKLCPKIILEGAADPQDRARLRVERTSSDRRAAQVSLPLADHLSRMVRLHGLPLGPRSCELRAGGRGDGHGDLRHVGPALRAAAILLVDHRSLPSLTGSTRGCTTGRIRLPLARERILPLGFHLVLCTSPETFEHARREIEESPDPVEYDNLGSLSRNRRSCEGLPRNRPSPSWNSTSPTTMWPEPPNRSPAGWLTPADCGPLSERI